MNAGRYTAKEIIEQSGLDPKQIGKVRVRIGGIRGINSPEHVLKVAEGRLDVIVGDQGAEIDVKATKEPVQSEGAAKVAKKTGKRLVQERQESRLAKLKGIKKADRTPSQQEELEWLKENTKVDK